MVYLRFRAQEVLMSNIAIKVQHLTKLYKLYEQPLNRLKEALHPFGKKYHKEFYALNDVSFEIKKGETVGIIGQNGAGKSTLLKIITGVLTPTNGHVHVNGRIASLLELGAGFNPEYTGIENIYFQGTLMGYDRSEMDQKLQEILTFADIGDFVYQPVKTYSSGMFARLAFAISINVEPDILIVDEALSVGDMNFQAKCMTAMDRIKQKGTTILFVSHDIGSVKSLCEMGIYIQNGQLHSIGAASEVAELYIKEMRENLNSEHKKFIRVQSTFHHNIIDENKSLDSDIPFKFSPEFDQRIAQFRYGNASITATYVEIVDMSGVQINEIEFNQQVKIRIYLVCQAEYSIAVNFHLFDDKRINITLGGFKQHNQDLLHVKNGEKYIVEYILKLPLQSNYYSIDTIIAAYLTNQKEPLLLDVIPNAFIFKVGEKKSYPLGSKVDLFPKISIVKV